MKSIINEKMKIMLVDDDHEIREVISILLSNENFDVIEAESGEDALRPTHTRLPWHISQLNPMCSIH